MPIFQSNVLGFNSRTFCKKIEALTVTMSNFCLPVGDFGVKWYERDDFGAKLREGVAMTELESPRFFGTHEHNLDIKGRLTLPSQLRKDLGQSCVVSKSQYGDPCLTIWRTQDFNEFSERFLNSNLDDDISARRRMRIWASEASLVEIDATGRLALPQRLRDYGNLTKEVIVVGVLLTIELWNVNAWNSHIGGQDVQ